MDRPLVSIVVPSYQQGQFLRAAIDSVLAQDYQPLEVLVMDGGSTDGSRAILESYGDRIWYRSQPDGGQCDAINEGFGRSRGEIVAWLNSDDFYYPGAISRAVEVLQRRPDVALAYGEGNLVGPDGEIVERFPETAPFDLWRLAHVSDYILQPTVFFRRSALFESGMLDESLEWGLDWDLWIRLGSRRHFAYVPELLAASRIYDDTKTARGGFRRLRELLRILRSHGVVGLSPAAVAHTLTTVARTFQPSQGPVTTGELTKSMPQVVSACVRPAMTRVERRLRRWLDDAQGVWADGMVGSHGHLWLPHDGRAATLRIRGRNLEVSDQVVALRVGRACVRTPLLAPREPFELEVPVGELPPPLKAQLSCVRTVAVPRVSAGERRRAGFVIDEHSVVAG